MQRKQSFKILGGILILMALTLALGGISGAQVSYKVIYPTGSGYGDCYYPHAAVIFDAAGNLYGTCPAGGSTDWGTVFELSPNPDGTWTPSVLYTFPSCGSPVGPGGGCPLAPVIFDANGNLYGTAVAGGLPGCTVWAGYGCGVVFELTPNSGGTWSESVLYTFTGGADGANPFAGLVLDATGNLYGTTAGGGTDGYGVVFKLTPGSGGNWTESVLHSFTGGDDGAYPQASVIFDAAGNLYGTAAGGFHGQGVIFKMAPNPDGSWSETVIRTGSRLGSNPYGGLIFDKAGNLYGTVSTDKIGGWGNGAVFELTPNPDGSWTPQLLYRFIPGGSDGSNPQATLTFDSAGNLYGTTVNGGIVNCGNYSGCGTVFQLRPNSEGGWTERVIHRFVGGEIDGYPYAGVTFDKAGNLYGAAAWFFGDIFEISPSPGQPGR
jgi:uncharacterized repeat protein (TIGR03803 family)